MSGGAPTVNRRPRWTLSPRLVSLLIVLGVCGATLRVWHLGWLQFLEFHAYDFFLQHQAQAASSDPIVLVEMRESDIHSPTLDYPIYDNKLAELLRNLEAQHPAVIGLDIWRDIPVPKSGIYLPELNEVLLAFSNIVAIYTLDGIAPPLVLKSSPERLGFNDNLPADIGVDHTIPKVRRTVLWVEKAGQFYDSFPYQMATIFLAARGIEPEADAADSKVVRLGKARLRAFCPNDGAYVGADARGWQMLLDFKCPDDFKRFSVSEALSGRIPAGSLRDKIVVIGMNTPSVSDERVTPLRRDHRGVEVQAHATHQLLRQALEGEPPIRFWSDWLEDGWMLFWCAVGGAIGYRVRSPWRFAPALILALATLGGAAWLAFRFGWWIPVAGPAAALVPGATLVISYASFHEKKQRGQLMQLFSKQVSPDIAQALWEQRDEFLAGQRPRPQKLTATVLFTDLQGFTATSEKMDPALLMDWLNEYMEVMANTIMSHQGVVEKYIGDAIMAVFGVPLARTREEEIREDACNAVRCALAMGARLEELNARWKERGLPVCGMRVGIHSGSLIAGSLGSADRQEYTVLGDSVNTASRLESFHSDGLDPSVAAEARHCRILISEATCQLLKDEFQTRKVGTIRLKNKSEAVTVYSVSGRKV
jgi:adenylate cyclase